MTLINNYLLRTADNQWNTFEQVTHIKHALLFYRPFTSRKVFCLSNRPTSHSQIGEKHLVRGEGESVDEAGSPEVNDACIECVKRHMFRNAMIILVLTNWVKSNKKRKFWSLVVYWRTFELHHNWKKNQGRWN